MKLNLLIKALMAFAVMMYSCTSFAGTRHTYNFNINRPIDAQTASTCTAKTTLIKNLLGITATEIPNVTLKATWIGSTGNESFYGSSTTGDSSEKGHWFTQTGLTTSKPKNYCIKVVWNAPTFYVTHNSEANTEVGATYTVKEALLTNNDTLVYVFNVTIGAASVSKRLMRPFPSLNGWMQRKSSMNMGMSSRG